MKAYTLGITKHEFVTEMKAHQAADNFLKGTYDDGEKGCAVGCSLKSVAKLKGIKLRFGDHEEFEKHLGVPRWLARLEDSIFENVSIERSKTWPVEFSEAINEGADLNKIKIPFLIFIVESARTHTKNERSLAAIDGVLTELKKDVLDLEKLRVDAYADAYDAAAYAAAAAAAYAAAAYDADAYAAAAAAAAAAAYAVAYDADAYAAAAAAAAAYDVAYDADAYADAYAAAAAAAAYDVAYDAYAARQTEWHKFADKLLELMRGCP